MLEIYVHPHALKHGLESEDIKCAWRQYFRQRRRAEGDGTQIVSVGLDCRGRLIQMIGVVTQDGIMIYHALTPPTENVLAELGLAGR